LHEIDIKAVQAASDTILMDDFVRQNESFILRCASFTVHRFITKSDDEWSVALLAFSQAVRDYSMDKGGFIGFSKLVIRRKLIDYIRTQSKHSLETSVNPSALDGDFDEDHEDIAIRTAVLEQIERTPDNSLKLEIEAASQILSTYGFSFYDLAGCSPKAEKTKKACARAVAYIIHNPLIASEMMSTKLLPVKLIEKNRNIPRKIIERHRKYIIAAVEIMTGDYPFLAEYMRFIREELDR